MYNDLVQEGLLSCYESLDQYNPEDYDNKPERFFYYKALGGMSDYYNRRSRLVVPPKGYRGPKTGDPTTTDEKGLREAVSYVSFEDEAGGLSIPSGNNQAKDYEENNLIDVICSRVFSRLDNREREILSLRYFSHPDKVMSQSWVGANLSKPLTGARVSSIESEIFEKLK